MIQRLTDSVRCQLATPARKRAAVGVGVAIALLVTLLFVARRTAVSAPAIVDYEAKSVIRADSPGFLRELRVQAGDHVDQGQLLAVLDNPQLRSELFDVETALQRSRQKAISFRNRDELAAYQAELGEIASLEKRLAEKQAELALLTLRAPTAGAVVSRRLKWKLGAYFSAGAEILTIGRENRKEVVGSVSQDDVKAFHAAIGRRVTVEVSGLPSIEGTLKRVSPTASSSTQHVALYAINGGPLPVRRRDQPLATAAASQSQVELVAPRFTAFVELDGRQSLQLRAGQGARIRLR